MPLGVRFGREPKCVRGKTVIPRTIICIVMLGWFGHIGLLVLFSGNALRLYKCYGIPRMYLCNRLKCYLWGDALHGSGSRINPIKCHRSCVIHYFPNPPGSLHVWLGFHRDLYITILMMVSGGPVDGSWVLGWTDGNHAVRETFYGILPNGHFDAVVVMFASQGVGAYMSH